MTSESIIVKIYENLKVIHVDEETKDEYIKSNDGYLEISLDDTTNEIYLILYIFMTNETVNKTTLLNIKLNEFNFSNFVSLNRIAFKKNKLFDLTSFYTIEFANANDYFDLKKTLISLKEIYIDIPNQRVESLSETDFFTQQDTHIMEYEITKTNQILDSVNFAEDDNDCLMKSNEDELDFFCKKLKEAIYNGDENNSIKYASQLAKSKANLFIGVSKTYKDKLNDVILTDNINQDTTTDTTISDSCKLVLTFKNENDRKNIFYLKSSTKILQLKEKIFSDFKIPIEYQFLVLNDCSTNDDDLLEIYTNKINASTSRGDMNRELNAHLFVFSKNLNEWNCSRCTFINIPEALACKMCQNERVDYEQINFNDNSKESVEFKIYSEQLQERMRKKRLENYNELATLAYLEINENTEPFDCDICLEKDIPAHNGVILKECLHLFCKLCLVNHINYYDDSIVKCPYAKEYNCMYNIQEREIKALLSTDEFKRFQLKSLRLSEASMKNAFHCKTPDCIGFCIHEDDLNFFECEVCEKVSCLRCNTIHMGKTCKEYQDDLKLNSENDENSRKNIEALQRIKR